MGVPGRAGNGNPFYLSPATYAGVEAYYYKAEGASDETYTTALPTAEGRYTAKVVSKETDTYASCEATTTLILTRGVVTYLYYKASADQTYTFNSFEVGDPISVAYVYEGELTAQQVASAQFIAAYNCGEDGGGYISLWYWDEKAVDWTDTVEKFEVDNGVVSVLSFGTVRYCYDYYGETLVFAEKNGKNVLFWVYDEVTKASLASGPITYDFDDYGSWEINNGVITTEEPFAPFSVVSEQDGTIAMCVGTVQYLYYHESMNATISFNIVGESRLTFLYYEGNYTAEQLISLTPDIWAEAWVFADENTIVVAEGTPGEMSFEVDGTTLTLLNGGPM